MYPRPQKRSHPHPSRSHGHQHSSISSRSGPSTSSSTTTQIPPIAYIQAYEAQLVYGQDNIASEVTQRDGTRGLGLIRYAGEVDGEEGESAGEGSGEIWSDRHDILHLLPSIPSTSRQRSPPSSPATSSSSWDSLPSDIEETFYLSDPEEIEAYEQQKKRKWIEALREERLKEREKEDKEVEGDGGGRWDEDEEPPEPILVLMKHIAKAILSSPNPSVLELRILTNHSSDEKFSFLKGRYKSTWNKIKNDLIKEKQAAQRKEERSEGLGLGLGGLRGYDSDSDSDSGSGEEDQDDIPPPPPPPEDGSEVSFPPPPPPPTDDDLPPIPPPSSMDIHDDANDTKKEGLDDEEEKKRIRRARMEEWKKKRAAEKGN